MIKRKGIGSYEYYQREYENVVNKFSWNVGFFDDRTGWANICYKESVDMIEKLYQSSVVAGVSTAPLRLWALLAVKRRLDEYKKRGSISG